MKFLFLSFLLFSSEFVSIIKSQDNCKVIINELNITDTSRPEKNQFVELKSTCGGIIPLHSYKLIGINAQTKPATIDLIITLWNERTNANGFFTIGGSEVPSADMKIPHDMVKFKSSFTGRSSLMAKFMPNTELRAIGLLHDSNTNNAFKDFVFSIDRENK